MSLVLYGNVIQLESLLQMQGSGNNQMRGIIPRSIEKVLVERDKQSKQGWKYNMHVSFLEIYNETIRDLLNSTSAEKVDAKKYQIKQKGVHSKEVYVTELTMVEVETLEKVEWLMEKATRQRSVGSTDMNEQSSRSHSVFTLHIDGKYFVLKVYSIRPSYVH